MNRLLIARPILRTMVQSNIVPVQKRFSSYDIGPPASFNQIPHPEGDWNENYQTKQSKYNTILAGASVFFLATLAFLKQTGIIYFNATVPETYE